MYDADKNVKEFLERLPDDFFIGLSNYKHYLVDGFDTDELSLFDIISIAEYTALTANSKPTAARSLPNIKILAAVMFIKLYQCEDKGLMQKAHAAIDEMYFYKEIVSQTIEKSGLTEAESKSNSLNPDPIIELRKLDVNTMRVSKVLHIHNEDDGINKESRFV